MAHDTKTPGHLSEKQRAKWNQLVSSHGDRPQQALEAYVCEWCRWQESEEWLRANGEVVTIRDDKGNVKSLIEAPQLKIARSAEKLARELAKQLRLEH